MKDDLSARVHGQVPEDGDPAFDEALIEPQCQASVLRYSWADDNGRSRILFANPASRQRNRMTVRMSYDEGRSWPVSRLVDGGYSAYSCLAVLPDGSTHAAHFNSAFQEEFTQFNVALATQLLTVPFPSPASGYTYTFDESLGVFTRSTQSFGPILTERAETIGKGKFTFGFAYQRFRFDSIEGVDLGAVPGAGGDVRYYNVIGACNGNEAAE